MDKNRKRAIIYLMVTAFLWSIGGLFIKLVEWNPMAIAGARSGIAALVIYLYLGRPKIKFTREKVWGAFFYAATVILFVMANKLTTSANAILLQFTSPIWVALFCGWILKEKVLPSDWVTIGAVLVGMGLFFLKDLGSGRMLGNILGLISGVAFAGVIIFLKLQRDGNAVEMTLVGNIFTFLVAIPFYFTAVPSGKSIMGLLILGIFQLGISYILFANHVRYVSAVEAVLIPVIEPLLNPLWVYLVTKEAPSGYTFLGGLMMISAIIARGIYQARRYPKPIAPAD